MITELDAADYAKVRPLFAALDYQPFCTAVLAGIFPGRVVVDDADHLRAAFVNTEGVWCFLAGRPDSDGFNRALNRALFDREIVNRDVDALFFTCEPGDWGGQLAAVCNPRQPIPVARRHYVCRELAYDWQAHVPDGFTLRRMDDALLDQPGLEVPDDVIKTLDKWRSIAAPGLADFGFVAIDDEANEVVSWAMADDPPCWVYFDAARVWAALGNRGKAFRHLRIAVEGGWTDVDGAEHCPEFEELRGSPEWAACWRM